MNPEKEISDAMTGEAVTFRTSKDSEVKELRKAIESLRGKGFTLDVNPTTYGFVVVVEARPVSHMS